LNYTTNDIARIIGAKAILAGDLPVEHLLLDSRKVYSPVLSLFFALEGVRRDGHRFIPELYKKGVRNFVVSKETETTNYPEANFLFVADTLAALQQLAAFHRARFTIPVVGITGSNGKTIVKEWLYQLLHEEYNIVRSPRSYNSQVGVPLSVWQMNEQHTLGIFEAGISTTREMEKLEKIIQPSLGILTNIGEAHNEGFSGSANKLSEKLKLFDNCDVVIGKENYFDFHNKSSKPRLVTWGESAGNALIIKSIDKKAGHTIITYTHSTVEDQLMIPFTDDASIENAITCCLVTMQLGLDDKKRKKRMKQLQAVNMRLELKKELIIVPLSMIVTAPI
jgi:alanine racemase